jgi:hypothetical protein
MSWERESKYIHTYLKLIVHTKTMLTRKTAKTRNDSVRSATSSDGNPISLSPPLQPPVPRLRRRRWRPTSSAFNPNIVLAGINYYCERFKILLIFFKILKCIYLPILLRIRFLRRCRYCTLSCSDLGSSWCGHRVDRNLWWADCISPMNVSATLGRELELAYAPSWGFRGGGSKLGSWTHSPELLSNIITNASDIKICK